MTSRTTLLNDSYVSVEMFWQYNRQGWKGMWFVGLANKMNIHWKPWPSWVQICPLISAKLYRSWVNEFWKNRKSSFSFFLSQQNTFGDKSIGPLNVESFLVKKERCEWSGAQHRRTQLNNNVNSTAKSKLRVEWGDEKQCRSILHTCTVHVCTTYMYISCTCVFCVRAYFGI